MDDDFPPAVARLIRLGEPLGPHWRDYAVIGITPEHVPDLLRVLRTPEYDLLDSEDPEVWAPLHAWRALAELRAPEVVANMLERLDDIDDSPDDWLIGDFAEVMRRVGAPAFEPLATYLRDPAHRDRRSWTVAEGIAAVGLAVPELRPRAVEVIETALRDWRHNTEDYNAGLVCGLLDLKAKETMPLVREAMEAGAVDEFIVGTVEDVEYEFGLRDRPPRVPPFAPPGLPSPPASMLRAERNAHDRARARRKQAKAAKKRNRRK